MTSQRAAKKFLASPRRKSNKKQLWSAERTERRSGSASPFSLSVRLSGPGRSLASGESVMAHSNVGAVKRAKYSDAALGNMLSTCSLDVKLPNINTTPAYVFVNTPISLEVHLLGPDDCLHTLSTDLDLWLEDEVGTRMAAGARLTPAAVDGAAGAPGGPVFTVRGLHKLVDGVASFEAIIQDPSLVVGNRVKLVLTAPGKLGTNLEGTSQPLTICRGEITLLEQPTSIWYKDEGGRGNCLSVKAKVVDITANNAPLAGVPLKVDLVYKDGKMVDKQTILEKQTKVALVTDKTGVCSLQFRILEVSQRHQGQDFAVRFTCDTRKNPTANDIAPAVSSAISVLSKRKKRVKQREVQQQQQRQQQQQQQARSGTSSVEAMQAVQAVASHASARSSPRIPIPAPVVSHLASSSSSSTSSSALGAASYPSPTLHSTNSASNILKNMRGQGDPLGLQLNPRQSALGGTSVIGAWRQIQDWSNDLLLLLNDTLQWQPYGFGLDVNGQMDPSNPLFRCPCCRVCKDRNTIAAHGEGCKLRDVLDTYSRRIEGCCEIVETHVCATAGPSSPEPSFSLLGASAGTGGGGGGGGGGDMNDRSLSFGTRGGGGLLLRPGQLPGPLEPMRTNSLAPFMPEMSVVSGSEESVYFILLRRPRGGSSANGGSGGSRRKGRSEQRTRNHDERGRQEQGRDTAEKEGAGEEEEEEAKTQQDDEEEEEEKKKKKKGEENGGEAVRKEKEASKDTASFKDVAAFSEQKTLLGFYEQKSETMEFTNDALSQIQLTFAQASPEEMQSQTILVEELDSALAEEKEGKDGRAKMVFSLSTYGGSLPRLKEAMYEEKTTHVTLDLSRSLDLSRTFSVGGLGAGAMAMDAPPMPRS